MIKSKATLFMDPRINFKGSNSPYLTMEGKAQNYLLKVHSTLLALNPITRSNNEESQ